MLNSNALAKDIQEILDDILKPALEAAIRGMCGEETEASIEKAQTFAENFTEMLSQPFSERLAASIDHYIKSGSIYGTIITAGTPFTQTAVIPPGSSLGMVTSGKVPNTLGIQ